MTFEEFFKKKKISLELLKAAEPELFAEFEWHYSQMGEKSFDHTKKYLFNRLRGIYHTPDEPKVEKLRIENPLAEQTIIESVSEPLQTAAPKMGYTPKFKSAVTQVTTPAESTPVTPEEKTEPANNTEASAPKLGFKPKFKSAATPAESTPAAPEVKAEPTSSREAPAPKLGFKPKFKSAVTPATPTESTLAAPEVKAEPTSNTEAPAPKLGFKPKFKSTATPVAPVEATPTVPEEKAEPDNTEPPAPKLGFKPKFKSTQPAAKNASASSPQDAINSDDTTLSGDTDPTPL